MKKFYIIYDGRYIHSPDRASVLYCSGENLNRAKREAKEFGNLNVVVEHRVIERGHNSETVEETGNFWVID